MSRQAEGDALVVGSRKVYGHVERAQSMTNVLSGVRVLEVATFAMAPSAGAVLAEWGATVIKVEHLSGDPTRGLSAWGLPTNIEGFHCLWEPLNRGKRSVALDIGNSEGRRVVLELARTSDIFLTNFLPSARARLGIDVVDIKTVNPRVIYARATGHGPNGPDADRGGFDDVTYWNRTGAGSQATPDGNSHLVHVPALAFGDCQAGMALAGGIAAALFRRERTGEGAIVDVSLLGAGMWAMQCNYVAANLTGVAELPKVSHSMVRNPLANAYRTADGRFLSLGMLQPQKYWVEFCEAIGRSDLATDSRFATAEDLRAHKSELIAELDTIFAERTADEWRALLDGQSGPWAIVQRVGDLNEDEAALANRYIQDVDYGDGKSIRLVAAPVQFDEAFADVRPAPNHGQSTEEVLLEAGYDWESIGKLKDLGAIG